MVKNLHLRLEILRLRKWVPYSYLIISVGITVLFLLGMGSYSTARGMTPPHEWMLSLFLTFLVTKIFFTLILFLGISGVFLWPGKLFNQTQ